MSRTIFGPSGNSASFYEQGYKHSYETPAWLKEMGLSWYEYSGGKGLNIRTETAQKVGQAAKDAGIGVSVHAPYYMNFASTDQEKLKKSRGYMHQALKAARHMGAKRVIFHPGSCSGMSRAAALDNAMRELKKLIHEIQDRGFEDIILCPETMGKIVQLGDLSETLMLCSLDESWLPTIDFGHLNARSLGGIKGEEDYSRVLSEIENHLGNERLKKIHIHFSQIEYTRAGERRHLTLEDKEYGPFFEPLARQLVKRKMSAIVVCESKNVMAEDAVRLKEIYESLL